MGAPKGNQYAVGNNGGQPPAFDSNEELQKQIDAYFDKETGDAWVVDGDKKIYSPAVSGLAYHLGITTETLRTYGNDDEFSATVKRAKQKIEMALERRLGGTACAGTIFNLKNNFSWKDKTEVDTNISVSDSLLDLVASSTGPTDK